MAPHNPKCRCGKAFRTTKGYHETLCANCEVKYFPLPKNPEDSDKEFSKLAEDIYGSSDPEIASLNCNDIFNHGARLNKITANNIPEKREIQRLKEEHDAVQRRLAQVTMQTASMQKIMKAILLSSSVSKKENKVTPVEVPKTSKPIAEKRPTPISKESNLPGDKTSAKNIPKKIPSADGPGASKPPRSPRLQELKKDEGETESVPTEGSPVKQAAAFFEQTIKRNSSMNGSSKKAPPPPVPAPVQIETDYLVTAKDEVPVVIVPLAPTLATPTNAPVVPSLQPNGVSVQEGSTTPSELTDDDETVPFQRSNSVKNRIKAFEALTRSASTGSWDRNGSSRRRLQF